MAIVTFSIAAKLAPDVLDQRIHYAAMEQDSIMSAFPLEFWEGGKSASYIQLTTLPTPAWRDETDVITPSAADYATWTVYLKNLAGDNQIPIANQGGMSGHINQKAAHVYAHAIAICKELRKTITDGSSVTTTVGSNVVAKGWDLVRPGPNMTLGNMDVEFDDTADKIRVREPGATSFGPWSATITADLDEVVLYCADTTKYVYVSFDFSDSDGGGNYTSTTLGGNPSDYIVFASSKKPDGLASFCHPTQRIWANLTTDPADAGTALSTDMFDWLIDKVPGDKGNLVFLMPLRTRRSFKSLMGTSALDYVDTWMGQRLARKTLSFEGIPIWACDSIPQNVASGIDDATSASCTSLFLARVDPTDGLGCFYYNGGPQTLVDPGNFGGTPGNAPCPIYYRELGEQSNVPDYKDRMDTNIAPYLKNYQALAEVIGVNN